MRGSSFIYFIKDAFKNIWKNKVMSFASVGVLTACLLIMGSSILLSINLHSIVDNIEKENEFVLFIKDDITQDQLNNLETTIKSNSNVSSYYYTSKQQALEDYIKDNEAEADLIAGLGEEDILPATFTIKTKDASLVSGLVDSLSKLDGVDKIRHNQDFTKKVNTLSNTISIVGIWLVLILAGVALFIVSNTIKLAMFTRKREINIMKFVGATNGFIRWPFFIEGLILGAVSCIISIVLQWYVYVYLIEKMILNLDIAVLTPVPFREVWLIISAIFVLVGFIVGGIGSMVSIRKYIDV